MSPRYARILTNDVLALRSGSRSFEGTEVKTKVGEATIFYPATADHQNYLMKNPGGYCNHYMRFKAWPLA